MFDTAPAQVGYMNAQHQRVIAHALSRDQRLVLVVRCAICGHQYGSAADDIVARHCPGHEKALAGLPAEAGNVDWLERPLRFRSIGSVKVDAQDDVARPPGEMERIVGFF